MTQFILASQSPRRKELLAIAGYPFEVIIAEVDENSVFDAHPGENCVLTAQLKAHSVAQRVSSSNHKGRIIIAADTSVAVDEKLLGKPDDAQDAKDMLTTLRDRTHEVYTGVAILVLDTAVEISGYHEAIVTMRNYDTHEIKRYIRSGDPFDKAGAYGIQHPQFRPVAELDGCFLGVMGLSICHLITLLDQLKIPRKFDFAALKAAHQGYPCPVFQEITRNYSKKSV